MNRFLDRSSSCIDLNTIPEKAIWNLDTSILFCEFTGKIEELRHVELRQAKIGNVLLSRVLGVPKTSLLDTFTAPFDKIQQGSQEQVEISSSLSTYPIILGNQVFEKHRILFDFSQKQLHFFSDNEFSLPKEDGWVEVPFAYWGGMMVIPAQWDGETRWLMIDTGASKNFLLGKKHALSTPMYLQNGNVSEIVVGGHSLAIDFLATNRSFPETFTNHQHIDGILGMPFLLSHRILIDFPNKKLSFHPIDDTPYNNPIQ